MTVKSGRSTFCLYVCKMTRREQSLLACGWDERTSMFSAVLLMLYVVDLPPRSRPMLARPLDMLTIVFFWPFSRSGRYA